MSDSVILKASRYFLAQAKSAADAGIWRTTDEGSRIYITNAGEVRGGGPMGPVISKAPSKPTKKRPAAKKPEKKVGIVDKAGKPAVRLESEGYREMHDDAEAWSQKLNESEWNAVTSWTDAGYDSVRKEFASGSLGEESQSLKSALDKGGFYKGETYRGIGFSAKGLDVFSQKMESIGVGGIWQDAAPASATVATQVAYEYSTHGDHPVFFKMKTKSGTYVENMTENEDEFEVIIRPGAKFKITGLSRNQELNLEDAMRFSPALYIEMEEID